MGDKPSILIIYTGGTIGMVQKTTNGALVPMKFDQIQEEVPDNVKRTSALLERVEMLTREEPVNIALIIRQWLGEVAPGQSKKH